MEHQSPAGCLNNSLVILLAKDKLNIQNGGTVNYTVTAENDQNNGCDITGFTGVFRCPDANGLPLGPPQACGAPNLSLPFPTGVFTLCQISCVVTVNPGITSATANVSETSILHDNPNSDTDNANASKDISVVIDICGDGIVGNTPGETCDPPNSATTNPPNLCRNNCTFCGDGNVDAGEQCEPGQPHCSSTCTILPFCGDGVRNESCETCDGNDFQPGAPASHGACRVGNTCGQDSCTFCGDGIVNGGEACDDGNNTNGDGCETNCTPSPRCGDGVRNESCETCDGTDFQPNAPASHGACRVGNTCGQDSCTFCGDGIVNGGEACDDGNDFNGDGCETNCTPSPRCGDNIINDSGCSETCDGATFPSGAPSSHGECRPGPCGTPAACTFCGDGIPNGGEACDDGNNVDTDACRNNCTLPGCSVVIAKTVAPDDGSGGGTACDGNADGPFAENVVVNEGSCVVYMICVTNTGQQVLNTSGVKVDDPKLGTVNLDFGTIAVGAPAVCKVLPGIIGNTPTCTGGSPAGTSCTCQQVEGTNTARISAAICEASQQSACSQPGSICSDTANVACLRPGSCRMTGGHNFDGLVDPEFHGDGKDWTTGGQIGAPNETGCCALPPKGKCVNGLCSGGLNGGLACTTNDQCPNDPGRDSHCPWGDWEHNHHSGPDDSGGILGGSFAFHSGTAASPDAAFIKSVQCADPGWCVQARPAPFKQIFWEGTGVFHNAVNGKDKAIPLPVFTRCASQPVPYDRKTGGTLHYYKAHVGDFGEPAGIMQKDPNACTWDATCTEPLPGHEPNGRVEINDCALDPVCLVEQSRLEKETALHPLCEAQQCSECPDLYEIEIHCTADPDSPIAYQVSHFIREGNFQLHPPVGDSCNPSCGNGVCEPGLASTPAETCETCSADCGPCQ